MRGRVQGVNFRQSAAREARRLGLTGWVMNRDDGAVETLAEGSRAAVDAYSAWLDRGPPSARVTSVARVWGPALGGYVEFDVRRF